MSAGGSMDVNPESHKKLPDLHITTALAVSFMICKCATYAAKIVGLKGGILPCITALVVALATMNPGHIGILAPSGETVALILMQVFFVTVGAKGCIWNVIETAPSIFAFASIQVAVHLVVILGLGKLLRFERKLLFLASNANIGGPTTACGMATTKGWNSLIAPSILVGIFGITIANFLGIFFGLMVLKNM